jgi:ribose transport system substrate-binding protein
MLSTSLRRSVVAAAIVLTASAATAWGATPHSNAGQITVTPKANYTTGLPASISALYKNGVDVLGPSAYSKWKAAKGPWTICFNNSYLGNTWRAAALTEFNTLAQQYKKAGLVTKFLSTNSNLNLATQIQQMRDMISVDHCSGIITIPTGTSGMNSVIKQAYGAGIPVVDDLGPTTSPYAENFDENFYVTAYKETQFLAKSMGGKGNLLDVVGIPGETIDVEDQKGLKDALKAYPNVKVIGSVTGQVTDSIAQGQVMQFLSTHPQSIQAAFSEGGMETGIITAFKQENRPIPAIGWDAAGSTVAIVHDMLKSGQKPKVYGLTDPPAWSMKESFLIMVRLLEGQHPKNVTIYYPPPVADTANVNKWWSSKLTPTSTAWPEPPVDPMPTSVMSEYFANGKAPLPYQGHS